MPKNRGKALFAATVLTLGVGSCAVVSAEETPKKSAEPNAIVSTYNYDNRSNIDGYIEGPIAIKEEDFSSFSSETLFTLFSGIQLYDYSSNSTFICPDTINNKTVVVRGIKTNGDITLIELPNGQRKYVYADDLVQRITFEKEDNERRDFKNLTVSDTNDDYTVNKDAYVYNREGICEGYLEEGTRCLEIARVDNYMFVITENEDYLFIKINDVTLTKQYNKSLFAPKKLDIDKEKLMPYKIYQFSWFDTNSSTWSVDLDGEVFTDNIEQPYRTIYKNNRIFYRNGDLEPSSNTEGLLVKVIRESENLAYVMFEDGTYGYVSKRALAEALILDRSKFTPTIQNRNQLTRNWTYFYSMNGAYQDHIWPGTDVLVIETDGTYALIEFKSGERGYLLMDDLIESENKVNRYTYIKPDAKFYYKNPGCDYEELDDEYYKGGCITYLFYIDGEYAYVGDYYCRENYFVKVKDLDLNYNITDVSAYGYVSKDTNMNSKIDGTGVITSVDDFDLYWIWYNCGDYSYVYNVKSKEYGYIKTDELKTLSGCFYYVDIDAQRVYYYDDHDGRYYTVSHEWPMRSGNDANPSHEGAFDIDWKAKDFAFTTHPGAYAKYWIPFSEYDEGFHDLVGDDEENYGDESYHTIGSLGCFRVPVKASEFIYNTSPVGTMVLVNRK